MNTIWSIPTRAVSDRVNNLSDMKTSLAIHPKVVGGGLSGLLTLVVLQLLTRYGINVSGSVEGEITLGLSLLGGYLSPIVAHEEQVLVNPLGALSALSASYYTTTGGGGTTPTPPTSPAAKKAQAAKS